MTPRAGLRLVVAVATVAAVAALAFTPLRSMLEAGMRPHMLVQYPLLMLAGALIASVLPASTTRPIARFNGLGISGLTLAAAVLAVAMIPRVLDLALLDTRVEVLKFAALMAAGAVAPASWRAAGAVVQAFFLGIALPMTVAAGSAYIEAPVRLCNAYRIDEQQRLGAELIVVATLCGVAWVTLTLYRHAVRGDGA